MGFQSIRLYHYRNLRDAEIQVDAPEIFLIGENGQGKTNFLESVYLLCTGSSFRSRFDTDIVTHGESDMSLSGVTRETENRPRMGVSLKILQKKKHIEIAGKKIADRKSLIEQLPCIVFCHEDIDFVSGPPERRRWFFNQTMSLNTPMFVDTIRRYNRIIRMRNAAIRDDTPDLLPVFDQQVVATGLEIQKRRFVTVDEFNETFTKLFAFVSALEDPVTIRYSPSWKDCETIDRALEILESKRDRDRVMQTSTSGPHLDRFTFRYRDKDFARTASTGQLRLLSLVLRVAQAVHFTLKSTKLPILLLDDVLLELDPEKRRRFIEVLPEYDQAYFTFLPDERYDRYRREHTMLYTVSAGNLEERHE
jgi:DNA replication and repair protein RecF